MPTFLSLPVLNHLFFALHWEPFRASNCAGVRRAWLPIRAGITSCSASDSSRQLDNQRLAIANHSSILADSIPEYGAAVRYC